MSGFLPSLETVAKGAFATAAGLATLTQTGAGLIYYGQNYLIYPSAYIKVGPDDGAVHTPADYGLSGEEIDLRAQDGVLIRCYLLPQYLELPRPKRFQSLPITPAVWKDGETDEDYMARRPTVIMFHGNGGNVGHRIPLGYGNSKGTPSERGFQMDAQAALDYVLQDPRFGKTPIILYGQSIGGAVSIDLASRNPDKITALVLENTFTSLPALVPHVLPLLGPFTFLCHQKWESEAKIFGYVEGQNSSEATSAPWSSTISENQNAASSSAGASPSIGGARGIKDKRYKGIPKGTRVLLLSGKMDQLVPPEHMEALRVAFKARTKTRKSLGIPGPIALKSKKLSSGLSTPGGMRFNMPPRTRTLSMEKEWEVLDEPKDEKVPRVEQELREFGVRGKKVEKEQEEEERSRWEEFPSGSHNDTSAQAGYWNVVEEFVSEVAREWTQAREVEARL